VRPSTISRGGRTLIRACDKKRSFEAYALRAVLMPDNQGARGIMSRSPFCLGPRRWQAAALRKAVRAAAVARGNARPAEKTESDSKRPRPPPMTCLSADVRFTRGLAVAALRITNVEMGVAAQDRVFFMARDIIRSGPKSYPTLPGRDLGRCGPGGIAADA